MSKPDNGKFAGEYISNKKIEYGQEFIKKKATLCLLQESLDDDKICTWQINFPTGGDGSHLCFCGKATLCDFAARVLLEIELWPHQL